MACAGYVAKLCCGNVLEQGREGLAGHSNDVENIYRKGHGWIMKEITLREVADACGGQLVGGDPDLRVRGVEIDSRKVGTGFLFVPIKGNRVDGHDFIGQVFEKGAACTLSEREMADCPGPWIKVESAADALKKIAKYYRSILDIQVVGISGSMGKTSTKEMVAAVLAQKYRVLKTEGNYNNEIGLPLTIFRIEAAHQVAVLEMGISEPGEMSRLAQVARPDIGVLTNIGYCHMETLFNREGIFKAKTEMFQYLAEGGRVVLNGDDDWLSTVTEVNHIKPCFFGMGSGNDVRMGELYDADFYGTSCEVCLGEEQLDLHIPLPGTHQIYNALAAAAVGRILGLTGEQICRGIETVQTVSGRGKIVQTNGLTVIDDCYNANPASMKAGLDLLGQADGRKVAVLGDMFELGPEEGRLHFEVGEYAALGRADCLICIGTLAKELYRGAKSVASACEIHYLEEKSRLRGKMGELFRKGDTVLIKASHGMAFEEILPWLGEMG